MPLVYSFSNDGFTGVRWSGVQAKADAEGLCFGYSTIWCVKMQEHPDKPLLTKPDQFGAAILQQRVEQMPDSWDTSVKKLVALRGNGCGPQISEPWGAISDHIINNPGHYIIDIGDHWVAAANNGSYSFFDANEGMTAFNDANTFRTGVQERLKAYRDDPDPNNGWSDTHNFYDITK